MEHAAPTPRRRQSITSVLRNAESLVAKTRGLLHRSTLTTVVPEVVRRMSTVGRRFSLVPAPPFPPPPVKPNPQRRNSLVGNAANPIGIPTTAAPDSLNHSSPLRMSALASLAARTSANNSLRGSRKSDDSGQLKITAPGKGTDDRNASVKSRNTSQSSSKHRASLKVPPHHLTAGRPPVPAQYIEDCNAKFYEPRMLAARARLRWSPKIRRQALRLWRVAELKHKRMDKFEYLDFHLSVYRWLIDQNLNEDDIGPQDDHDALAAGLEDWERDCAAGCVGLTCDAFVVSSSSSRMRGSTCEYCRLRGVSAYAVATDHHQATVWQAAVASPLASRILGGQCASNAGSGGVGWITTPSRCQLSSSRYPDRAKARNQRAAFNLG